MDELKKIELKLGVQRANFNRLLEHSKMLEKKIDDLENMLQVFIDCETDISYILSACSDERIREDLKKLFEKKEA